MSYSQASFATRLFRQRMPKVCVAITGEDAGEMTSKAERLALDNPFVEFRLDYLARPAAGLPKIKEFLEMYPQVLAIGTCRRAVNGGKFKGSVESQLEILSKAAKAGCQLLDVEVQTATKCKPQQIQKLKEQAALILSSHDFRATRNLEETLQKMLEAPADFYKIVTTATTLSDNVTMMKFLEKHSDKHSLVGLCMGEQGLISRVLGVRAGSAFTFAAVNPGEETAPGQATAQELRSVYRIEQVDAATRVYGVAGDPVAQSLSPIIMNAGFRRENVNAVYLALHAKTLKDLLTCVREIPLHGLSITMPYKQAMVEHLDNSDPQTARVGACNTVVRAQDGKLYGFNTDTAGIVRPLEERTSLQGARVLVLGAGGAARAAVFAVRERGAEVWICNRTAAKAQKLAREAKAKTVKRSELRKLSYDIIINATPVGMGGGKESPLNENEINAKYVMDMVYEPRETAFLKLAADKGSQAIPGIEMFSQQAAQQFEIWTGKPAPLPDMIHAIHLAQQERESQKPAKKKAEA